jgi:hypothetical protein
VRRSVRPVGACAKIFFLNKRKKSVSRCISRTGGGALIQPIAMEVYKFVTITNVINRIICGGCMLKGLVSAKGHILAFPTGS